MTVNLLALTESNAAILVNEAVIEPGSYEWLAMDIAAERGVRDSYVLTETGGEEEIELRVPSGRLRLVSGFDVGANEGVRLLFDWDMRQGLLYPPGQGQYMLKPAFRMLDVTEYGALQGTIAAATVARSRPGDNVCASDDAVDITSWRRRYVFETITPGVAVTPDDIDGSGDPVATVAARPNQPGATTVPHRPAWLVHRGVHLRRQERRPRKTRGRHHVLNPSAATNPATTRPARRR